MQNDRKGAFCHLGQFEQRLIFIIHCRTLKSFFDLPLDRFPVLHFCHMKIRRGRVLEGWGVGGGARARGGGGGGGACERGRNQRNMYSRPDSLPQAAALLPRPTLGDFHREDDYHSYIITHHRKPQRSSPVSSAQNMVPLAAKNPGRSLFRCMMQSLRAAKMIHRHLNVPNAGE